MHKLDNDNIQHVLAYKSFYQNFFPEK